MNKAILNEVTTKELDTFLRKIAFNKKNVVMIDTEDLVQEFWLTALETIERLGRIDYGYISKACNNKTVNIVRSNVNKFDYLPFDNSEFERCIDASFRSGKRSGSSEDAESHTYTFISNSGFETPEERIDLEEILNLFDEETEARERMLINAWMEILGIKEVDDCTKLPESKEDAYIAVEVLGYSGSKSNGYARLRNKVLHKLMENGYRANRESYSDFKRKF